MSTDLQRFGVIPGDGNKRIGFYLADTFGMLPFLSALEPLRAVNRYTDTHAYSWHLYGDSEAAALANNGMTLNVDGSIADAAEQTFDHFFVCGPHEPHHQDNPIAVRAIKRLHARGVKLGAIDTGTFLLADAQVLKGQKCTLHWENVPGFVESYPGIDVSLEIFEADGGVYTCAGGTAALDMMLTLILQDYGHGLTAKVAELFIHSGIRRASEPQRLGITQRTGIFHPGLVDCVELMEANIEQPLSTEEISRMISISKRQLERLFRAHLDTTPTHYYQQIRLQAGLKLLEQTSMNVLEIASACGFSSADHFSRRFRASFGASPREWRNRNKHHT